MLCEMMHNAFVELRSLCYNGRTRQAADLADAFHELPAVMYEPYFSWSFLRHFLAVYQGKYPREAGSLYDYLAMLEQIQGSAQTGGRAKPL